MQKNLFPSNYITLADLYLAYRKAKSEAFYDNLHPSALAFSDYEQKLQKNIESLYSLIIKGDTHWWTSTDFIGGYLYIPKSLDDSIWNNAEDVHYRSIDPNIDWAQRFIENKKKRISANYRLIITATVEYQIISALWILKVGHKFEARLNKNLSYGNRIRRSAPTCSENLYGPINKDSLGIFNPYFSAYRNWRRKGLDSMRDLVTAGKSVTALTMDLAAFYHNVSPYFLLRPSFLKTIAVDIDSRDRKFTQIFLDSMMHWYTQTPDYSERPEGALPVGLSASKVIANVLLFQLDEEVNLGIKPAYYGRYVDDIFLVFETPETIVNSSTALDHLAQNIPCLKINRVKDASPGLNLRFGYAADSDLKFTPSKQKIFSLSAEYGLDLIDQISIQIRAQSSEYRMLPEVPRSSVEMAEKTLLASPDASLIADALRKADVVSIRRLGLSLLIRDIESYSSDLSTTEWSEVRHQFYGLVQRYLVTPKGLFDLFSYYPRIFSLMIANYDFKEAIDFIERISKCFELITETTEIKKGRTERIKSCKSYFEKMLLQTAMQASTTRNFSNWNKLRSLLISIFSFSENHRITLSKKHLEHLSTNIMLCDFGSRAYKDYWYYSQSSDINKTKVPKNIEVRKILRLAPIRNFQQSANLKTPHWVALAFPTRPLTIQEIVLTCPLVLEDSNLFKTCIWGLRGAKTKAGLGISLSAANGEGCYLSVPAPQKDKSYIALTNFETTTAQFIGALTGNPDRSLARYEKINKLINNILRSNIQSNYIVFPECSIPRRWAIGIAGKLGRQGISLIAGLEYYNHNNNNKIIRNDCLVSLASRWPGYSSNFIYLQPKLEPSHGEAQALRKARKKQYVPSQPNEIIPIYNHGGYHFGILICSDLTNPLNRVRFQGKIDSLFVLEWNPDVKTFSFLVEGTAHDIHTFVVQVNNRLFGDSRVRAPYRIDHKRDSVRLKGGLEDYFVIAEIDYKPLRAFHKKGDMNNKNSDFKPVPIGFSISDVRRRLA